VEDPEGNGNTNSSYNASSNLIREPGGGCEDGTWRNASHLDEERSEAGMYIVTVFIQPICRKDNKECRIRGDGGRNQDSRKDIE